MSRASAVRGVAWGLAGQGGQLTLALAGWILLARVLDVHELGLAGMALVLAGLLSVGADLGMGVLAVQRPRLDDRRAHRAALAAGWTCFALLALPAPLWAGLYGSPEGLAPLVAAGGLLPLFLAWGSNARARLQRALSFGRLAALDLGTETVRAGLRVGLAVGGLGAWSILLGDAIALGLGAAAAWLVAPGLRAGDASAPVGDGLRLVGARAADAAFVQADRFAVGLRLGAGALGLYAFAWQHTLMAAQRLTGLAEQVALPLLARAREGEPLARAYRALTRAYALGVLPLAALLHVAAEPLVAWVYPDRWLGAVPALEALAVAFAAHGLNSHPGLVWIVRGRMRVKLLWSAANLALIAVLLPVGLQGGLRGVAWVLAARSLVATVAGHEITRRMVPVGWGAYLRALAPGTLLAGAVLLVARALS